MKKLSRSSFITLCAVLTASFSAFALSKPYEVKGETSTITFDFEDDGAHESIINDYGNKSFTENEIAITLNNGTSGESYPIHSNSIALKHGKTATSSAILGPIDTTNYNFGSLSFETQISGGSTSASISVSFSTDQNSWTEVFTSKLNKNSTLFNLSFDNTTVSYSLSQNLYIKFVPTSTLATAGNIAIDNISLVLDEKNSSGEDVPPSVSHNVNFYNTCKFVLGEMPSQAVEDGSSFLLPTPSSSDFLKPSNITFAGWSLTDGGNVIDGDSITITDDTNLYAVWDGLPTVSLQKATFKINSTIDVSVSDIEGEATTYLDGVGAFNKNRVMANQTLHLKTECINGVPEFVYLKMKSNVSSGKAKITISDSVNTSYKQTISNTGVPSDHNVLTGTENYFILDSTVLQPVNFSDKTFYLKLSGLANSVFLYEAIVYFRAPYSYNLSFDANASNAGVVVPETMVVPEGTIPVIEFEPTQAGYVFLGWSTSTSADDIVNLKKFNMPSSNTTLYAIWRQEGIDSLTLDKSSISINLSDANSYGTVKPTVVAQGNTSDAVTVTFDSSFVKLSINSIDLKSGDVISNKSEVKVEGKKVGEGSIVFTASDNSTSASCDVTVDIPELGTKTGYYKLVTNKNELKHNDHIILVTSLSSQTSYVFGEKANTYFNGKSVVTNDGYALIDENNIADCNVITLKENDGFWNLLCNDGYLHSETSGNTLKAGPSVVDGTYSWTIEFDNNSSIIKSDATGSNWIRFYSTANRFNCYGSGQKDVFILKQTADKTDLTSITLNDLDIYEGQRNLALSYSFSPSNASIQNIFWTSADESIATVSANGLVTAASTAEVGDTVTITGEAPLAGENGATVSATCTVTITEDYVVSISDAVLTKKSYVDIEGGNQIDLSGLRVDTILASGANKKGVSENLHLQLDGVNADNYVFTSEDAENGSVTFDVVYDDGVHTSSSTKLTVTVGHGTLDLAKNYLGWKNYGSLKYNEGSKLTMLSSQVATAYFEGNISVSLPLSSCGVLIGDEEFDVENDVLTADMNGQDFQLTFSDAEGNTVSTQKLKLTVFSSTENVIIMQDVFQKEGWEASSINGTYNENKDVSLAMSKDSASGNTGKALYDDGSWRIYSSDKNAYFSITCKDKSKLIDSLTIYTHDTDATGSFVNDFATNEEVKVDEFSTVLEPNEKYIAIQAIKYTLKDNPEYSAAVAFESDLNDLANEEISRTTYTDFAEVVNSFGSLTMLSNSCFDHGTYSNYFEQIATISKSVDNYIALETLTSCLNQGGEYSAENREYTGNCVSNGWYIDAADEFNGLAKEQQDIFIKEYSSEYERLQAWAVAYGAYSSINEETGKIEFSKASNKANVSKQLGIDTEGTTLVAIIIGAAGVISIGSLFLFKKKEF